MKAIFTDYNFFGKKIFDVDTLEITGEPTSDRHVLTRKRGDLLKSEAIQQAVAEAKEVLVNQDQLELEVRQEVGVALPSAVTEELQNRLEVSSATISDNITVTVPISVLSELVTVNYSIQSDISNEKGVITIHETDLGLETEVSRFAAKGKYAEQIDFEARIDNGSIVLDIIGQGDGLLTEIKYRNNTFNSLEN